MKNNEWQCKLYLCAGAKEGHSQFRPSQSFFEHHVHVLGLEFVVTAEKYAIISGENSLVQSFASSHPLQYPCQWTVTW